MSIPMIPGFTAASDSLTLAHAWPRPAGDFPDELWPLSHLRSVTPHPTGWLTIDSHYFTDREHGGVGCVLIPDTDTAQALTSTTWIGRDLGSTGIWDDGTFEDGLTTEDRKVRAEFFVQVRQASGAERPIVELSQPFLWYWDAFPTTNGWKYLNRAGREQDLIRVTQSDESWKVEVRALELRHYLAARHKVAIVQFDWVPKSDSQPFVRVDDEIIKPWVHADFHATHERSIGGHPAFARVLGQYAITGQANSRMPRFEERSQDHTYPSFIYGVAPDGTHLTHTCNPDELGTYFDKDNSRLHYLTPVYFKREVLQPYAAEPRRYRITSDRLTCLDLWGVAISMNTAGLVEVYLGDLGRDLPSDEWQHWLAYNVPPEGQMSASRFRRDFLNQAASSGDPVGALRRARVRVQQASSVALGTPAWKDLNGRLATEFEALIGPLTNDPSSLDAPLLTLTKVLVDGIDVAPLKEHLQDAGNGEGSLSLLRRVCEAHGDTRDSTKVLRHLQAYRSRGGVAHLPGSDHSKAALDLGIAGLEPIEAFDSAVRRLTECLQDVAALFENSAEPSP